MGIDVYMRWKNQTGVQRDAQITGFSVVSGHVGYLREAYHGRVYATRVLAPEAFEEHPEDDDWQGAPIPAAVLRERLPETIAAVKRRYRETYKEEIADDDKAIKSYVDFVELAERVERETGEPVLVYASW